MKRAEQIDRIARDCIYFKGDSPCVAHELRGELCRCQMYCPRSSRYLIIQLSSPARVIRCSALAARIKADDSNCHLAFLTQYPELLSTTVDEPLRLDAGSVLRLQMDSFDVLYNLDMDKRACAITNMVNAVLKKGFYLRQGWPTPLDPDSHNSYLQALNPRACHDIESDDLRELFQLCGLEYAGEVAHLAGGKAIWRLADQNAVMVGLHPGSAGQLGRWCGWDVQDWHRLVTMLEQQGLTPLLLGDSGLDWFNKQVAEASQVAYPGPLGLDDMARAVDACEVLVSADGMVLEMAAALGTKVVGLKQGGADRAVSAANSDGYGWESAEVRIEGGIGKAGMADISPEQVFAEVMAIVSRGRQKEHVLEADAAGSGGGQFSLKARREQAAQNRRHPE